MFTCGLDIVVCQALSFMGILGILETENKSFLYKEGLVAQWIEHVATNHGVGGSTPSWPDFTYAYIFRIFSTFFAVHAKKE